MKHVQKFSNPLVTLTGEPRASVTLTNLDTLWFNTGTLCNLSCINCYIESSPRNDRLEYVRLHDVVPFLDEIIEENYPTREIGFTGGEPFMNPDILLLLEECLSRGFEVLVLTNAMRPMMRHEKGLAAIIDTYGAQLHIRVSLDHYTATLHDQERGDKSFMTSLAGLQWLTQTGCSVHVAGRTCWEESESSLRHGFQELFTSINSDLDASNPGDLVLFPEMDERKDPPEITTACWNILGKSPDDMMCAHSRMVVKKKGDTAPAVMACTLLAYDQGFNLGRTLKEADTEVHLNHQHCATFCVLGGGSCS